MSGIDCTQKLDRGRGHERRADRQAVLRALLKKRLDWERGWDWAAPDLPSLFSSLAFVKTDDPSFAQLTAFWGETGKCGHFHFGVAKDLVARPSRNPSPQQLIFGASNVLSTRGRCMQLECSR